MLATWFAVAAVSLLPGNVVTLPVETPLVHPGFLNWGLQDPVATARPGTRAIVPRVAPSGVPGVVEVKVFDGTGRHFWLEDLGLTLVSPPGAANRPENSSSGSPGAEPPVRYARRQADARKRQRMQQRVNLMALDAAIGGMVRAALAAPQSSSPALLHVDIITPEVIHPAVFNVPVFSMPVFDVEIFSMPVFDVPIFSMPVFPVPVF